MWWECQAQTNRTNTILFRPKTTNITSPFIVQLFHVMSSAYQRIELRSVSSVYPGFPPDFYSFLAFSPVSRRINFRHPAYPPENDLLFTLYAWDYAGSGLYYDFVYSACAIIAANRQNRYLSDSRERTTITADWGDILVFDDYYFHIPNSGNVGFLNLRLILTSLNTYRTWSFRKRTLLMGCGSVISG